MLAKPILVLNSGSSSIKFSMWDGAAAQPEKLLEGAVEGFGSGGSDASKFWVRSWLDGADGKKIREESPSIEDIAAAFDLIAKVLVEPPIPQPVAVGHRVVCGGPTVTENQRITPALIEEMEKYTNFAPLHAPSEIFLIRKETELHPEIPNFVCLDSWFHRDLPEVTRHLPIPLEYTEMGLRRFGAHGLSYESIVAHLEPDIPERLIVAHLGNGASVCAIRGGKSVDTSMGLTPTGGIISATRTGDIDPGVMIFLLRHLAEGEKDSAKVASALEAIVNGQSGLKGLSQGSSDMRKLREGIAKGDSAARLAVDEFTYVLRKYIGAYAAVLGGIDMLVFTGGIGEHDADTRAEVCALLKAFGVEIDADGNNNVRGEATISGSGSKVRVQVIPAAEDLMIARHVLRLMAI